MQKILKARMFKAATLLTLLCFLVTLFPKVSLAQAPSMTIAVLSFENTNKESKYDYLSSSIAESLSTFLIKYSRNKVTIVERGQIEKALKEAGFQLAGYTDINSAVEVGKLTNATHIIIGSYTVIDNVLRINARLISVQTGEAMLAESVTGKGGAESFNQINQLSAKVIQSLTGEKVKIENFKDVSNPFMPLQEITKIATKKNNLIWIIIGVAVIAVAALTLGKSSQKSTQTVNVGK